MYEQILNEYIDSLYTAGIYVDGWCCYHNMKDAPVAPHGEEMLLATDYGHIFLSKLEQLKEGQFIVVPRNTKIAPRCKCCGQLLPQFVAPPAYSRW